MVWQKKLRLTGPAARARSSATCARTSSGVSIAQGNEPAAPPAIAPAARSTPPAPAIGASRIGCVLPSRAAKRSSGQRASGGDGVIAGLVELDQAEAVAERVREHRQPAVGRVAGLAFLDGAGGGGSGDRRVHVDDDEVGMDGAPVPLVAPDVAAGGTDRRAGILAEEVDGHLAADQLDEAPIEAPPDLEPESGGLEGDSLLHVGDGDV